MGDLVPLSGLEGFRVEAGDLDLRGWEVVAADGAPLGTVDDLLVDRAGMAVREVVVALRDGEGRVRLPLSQTRIEAEERRVHLRVGAAASLVPYAPPPPGAALEEAAGGDVRLTVSEEELHLSKRVVPAGEVRVARRVETETVRRTVPRMREEVTVERRPLPEGAGLEPRQEGDTLYIPIVEEELVIEKRRVAREELVIRKTQVVEDEVVEATLRREVAEVVEADGSRSDAGS
ncbi:MAG TPA: DUF2382 domain-containing protein [Longimicrobium sp.]|nr:DUF2382 domain-containing protein [Longimicrobium sp.]